MEDRGEPPNPHAYVYIRKAGHALRSGQHLHDEACAAGERLRRLTPTDLAEFRKFRNPHSAVVELSLCASVVLGSPCTTWEEAVGVLGAAGGLAVRCQGVLARVEGENLTIAQSNALEAWVKSEHATCGRIQAVTARKLPVWLCDWLLAVLEYGRHLSLYRDPPQSSSARMLEELKGRLFRSGITVREYYTKAELGAILIAISTPFYVISNAM